MPAFVKEREDAAARQLELIAWWAEIFEVPCVAMDVADREAAGRLARAGADFVCLDLVAGQTIGDAEAAARAWSDDLAAAAGSTSVR